MLLFPPYRFGNPAAMVGGGVSGAFDALSTGIFAAISSRLLFSAFAASKPIRMRVQPGSTEADIPFASDYSDVDSTARTALLGSSDGCIVTAYDQTGLGSRDYTQGTAANQPSVKTTSLYTINGKQAFKGSVGSTGVQLATAGSVAHGIGTGDFLVSTIINRAADSVAPPLWAIGSTGFQVIGYARGFPFSSPAIYIAGTYNHFPASNAPLTVGANYVLTFTRESGTLKCYINGTLHGTTYANSTNITSDRLVLLGERTGSTWGGPDTVLEHVMATSVTNRAAIIASQMTYAGL